MPDNNSSNSESSARTIGKVMKAVFSPLRWIIVVVAIVILTIVLVAAAIKVVLRLNAVDNSNDSDSSNYREYGPVAYTESMDLSDIENGNISFGMSVQDMWDNDSRYSEYLNSVDELEYLLWAQLVTQYPYKSGVSDGEFNGTVHFTRFVSDNEQDMEWVSDSTLSNYVEKYNNGDSSVLNDALTSFSLNSDMTIKIAYLTEEEKTVVTDDEVAKNDALEKIDGSVATENGDGTYTVTYSSSTLSTTNISYVSYVQKYVLPFNLLWSIVVMGHSDMQQAIQLATSIADMAYDGEISLVIDDNNVYTESVDYYTYTLTEHYDGNMTATITEIKTTTETQTVKDDDGNETSTVTNSNTDERTEDYSTTVDDYQVGREDYYAEYTEIHDTNSPSIKIKYIESWCAIFENDATYTKDESSNASNPSEQDLEDTELVDVKTFSYDEDTSINDVLENMRDKDGNKSELEKWNEDVISIYNSNGEPDARSSSYDEDTGTTTTTTIDYTYTLTYTGEIVETENYMNIHEESTTTTKTSGYKNGTVTSPVFNDEIIEKFNDPSVSSVRGTIVDTDDDGWFIPALEVNDDTANLVDLIKYIFNKADDEDVSDTDFASLWNDAYSSYSSVSGGSSGISGNVGIIYDYFLEKGISPEGAAGILGNFQQESGCRSDNLQDSYESSLGSDEEYTSKVNSGTYSKNSFVNDSAGYGLAQWTFDTRKQALYEFAESWSSENGESFDISNIYMQLDFFWDEFTTSYTAVYDAIKDSTDVATATRAFCNGYESPGVPNMEARIENAQYFYQLYLENYTSGSDNGGTYTANTDSTSYIYGWFYASSGRTFTIYRQSKVSNWTGKCNRAAALSIVSGYSDDSDDTLIAYNDSYSGGILAAGPYSNESQLYFGHYGLSASENSSFDDKALTGDVLENFMNKVRISQGTYIAFRIDENSGTFYGKSGQQWSSGRGHWLDVLGYTNDESGEKIFISDSGYRAAGWYDIDEFEGAILSYVWTIEE